MKPPICSSRSAILQTARLAAVLCAGLTLEAEAFDINDNFIDFGTWSGGDPLTLGVKLIYTDDAPLLSGTFELRVSRDAGVWIWSHFDVADQIVTAMQLDGTHKLQLFDSVSFPSVPSITLDPIGNATSFGKPVAFSANVTLSGTSNVAPAQGPLSFDGSIVTRLQGDLRYLRNNTLLSLATGPATPPVTGLNSSAVAFGSATSATGLYSSAFGLGTSATANHQFVVGRHNIANASDGLFIVGNGANSGSKTNAFVVRNNGDANVTGVLTAASLTASYASINGNMGVTGTLYTSTGLYNSGSMYNHGSLVVNGGIRHSSASNASSTSIAVGTSVSAYGANSLASGSNTVTNGANSASFGFYTNANSYASAAFGRFSAFNAADSATTWAEGDALFIIGNGTTDALRKNAMLMKKNGATAIGLGLTTSTPDQTVLGKYNDVTTTTVDKTQGVFVVGAGSGPSIAERRNALRVLPDGTVVILQKGDLSMGTFTAGTPP